MDAAGGRGAGAAAAGWWSVAATLATVDDTGSGADARRRAQAGPRTRRPADLGLSVVACIAALARKAAARVKRGPCADAAGGHAAAAAAARPLHDGSASGALARPASTSKARRDRPLPELMVVVTVGWRGAALLMCDDTRRRRHSAKCECALSPALLFSKRRFGFFSLALKFSRAPFPPQ